MRPSEICGLTTGQVHLDVNHISGKVLDYLDLGIFDTKTGAMRTVPASPALKEVLQRRIEGLDPEAPVSTRKKGRYRAGLVSSKMRNLRKRAGVPYGDRLFNKKGEKLGIVFHRLRHARTSKWVEADFSDETIRRATGHKTLVAYRTYVKLVEPAVFMRLIDTKESKMDNSGMKTAESLQ